MAEPPETRLIATSPVPSEDLDDVGGDDDKKSKRKARNRVSAAASRARKKQWVDSLVQDEVTCTHHVHVETRPKRRGVKT